MRILRMMVLAGLAAAGVLGFGTQATAGGGHGPRMVVGGHPYHNGNYFVPPSSAYEATRVFPPQRYGFPAYYHPASYLPAGINYQPYTWYPGVPAGRAGGYYMSGYGYYHTINW